MEEDLVFKLLRRYAFSVKNIRVAFLDFVNYVEDYVKQHITEETDLLVYWTNPIQILQQEMESLEKRNLISILRDGSKRESGEGITIIVFDYLITTITRIYEKIQTKASRPFPGIADLSKFAPPALLEKRTAPQIFYDLMEQKDIPRNKLILIEWQNAPTIVMPSSLGPEMLLRPCLQKLKETLEQDKQMAIYTRLLSQGDLGKQAQIKAFLEQIKKDPHAGFAQLRETQKTYWLWSQLCYNIKTNTADREEERDEVKFNLLHSALILEAFANYYKEKAEKEVLKNSGLTALDALLNRPPYYYTYSMIKKFTDEYGTPLLSLYTEEDLKSFLTDSAGLLSFKVDIDPETERVYYIMKEKIAPLVKRLKGDASQTIKDQLVQECRDVMMRFESLNSFQDGETFRAKVSTELRIYSPILFALVNAYDTEIFTFTAENIVAEARQRLSFWYKFPLTAWIFWFYALICKKLGRPKSEKEKADTAPTKATSTTAATGTNVTMGTNADRDNRTEGNEWKGKLRAGVKRIIGDLVPPGSTLQHELTLYEQQWNTLLNIPTHTRLTEDVNASIRDNVQRSLKSIKTTDYTHVRLRKMADALSSSPALMKIENREELNMYIQLYILRILETI
jgi:hypothetical protein